MRDSSGAKGHVWQKLLLPSAKEERNITVLSNANLEAQLSDGAPSTTSCSSSAIHFEAKQYNKVNQFTWVSGTPGQHESFGFTFSVAIGLGGWWDVHAGRMNGEYFPLFILKVKQPKKSSLFLITGQIFAMNNVADNQCLQIDDLMVLHSCGNMETFKVHFPLVRD